MPKFAPIPDLLNARRWVRLILVAGGVAAWTANRVDAGADAAGRTAGAVRSWNTGTGFRYAALEVPAQGGPGFSLLPPGATGVVFSNLLSEATISTNRLLEIGSGVTLGDVDGDGWVDIYFCGLEGDNVLYRNLGGWRFEDITARAGVACPGEFSTGCVLVDFDGDGHLDLLVNSLGGGTRSFRNDGSGKFQAEMDRGLFRQFGATSMALADVEGDGDLDLYVANYRSDTFFDHPPGLRVEMRSQPDGTRMAEPRDRFVTLPAGQGAPLVLERGEPDVFYLNRGGGRFAAVPWPIGVFRDADGQALREPPTDWGLAVTFRDLNGDGRPDLYVCNDFVYWPDRIWFNEEGKRFRAAPRHALRSVSLSSMAVDVADINRDGFDDLFVVDMLNPRREPRAWQRPDTLRGSVRWPMEDPSFTPEVPRNTLQVNRGNGTWAEIARFAGVAATDWTPAALFLDVDLDGWEDLLVGTGNLHDVQDIDALRVLGREAGARTPEARRRNLSRLPSRRAASMAFRNRQDLTFEDVSAAWHFDQVGIAHGFALGDLDNDGDLDVVVNGLNEAARLLRNESAAPRIAVRLRGRGENTRGIGARIRLLGGALPQSQEMMAGGRFCSGDDAMRVFAATPQEEMEIEVHWRSGRRSVVQGARANRVYEIDEENAGPAPAPPTPVIHSLFEDVSVRVKHVHTDTAFDDFSRQPLLPRKLSTLGPGVSWADVDGDDAEDLIVGGGRRGRGVILRNNRQGGFAEWTGQPLPMANPRDQTTLLVWRGLDGRVRLVAGESNWEDADSNAPPCRVVSLSPGEVAAAGLSPLPESSSAGPLALADIDGDGDLDLFVGGRALPGRYPEPAGSYLYLNEGESFTEPRTFPYRGLVSGAIFSDMEGDGDPDLILACDWDALRVFRNDHGEFADASDALGLGARTGGWNGVAAGDFDEDGLLDYVATNWGRNGRTDEPKGTRLTAHLFYGDFAENGVVQTLLASFEPTVKEITPWREREAVITVIPAIATRFSTDRDYGRASIAAVLGERFGLARELRATTFDSMIFLNRTNRFEAHPLPAEAQWGPAFGVSVADFDGDGHEDLFLAQNFFGVDAETSRHDSGVGLVLIGDGHGGFRALHSREAGFEIYGEQRGCAVADFDGDRRTDLAVGQHGGPVKVLRNRGGKPGVRVRVRPGSGHLNVMGAALRLKYADGAGPLHEIRVGAGYWSQDSADWVTGTAAPPKALWIRWPGGAVNEWAWPAGAHSVVVTPGGVQAEVP